MDPLVWIEEIKTCFGLEGELSTMAAEFGECCSLPAPEQAMRF